MKKSEVQVGQVYTAKVSNKVVRVRIDRENARGGWDATNLETGKAVRIKTAQRLRAKVRTRRAAEVRDERDVCATAGCGQPAALTHLGRPRCAECYEVETGTEPEVNPTVEVVTGQAVPAGNGHSAARPRRTRKPAGDATPKRTSALDAAAQVLAAAAEPMNAKALIAAMAERGLWSSPNGKTPEATLYAAITREINTKGDAARFRKVERGQFTCAEAVAAAI